MPQNAGNIAAVLLAAGGGVRLGGGKLLLPWRGEPLIARPLCAAAETPGLHSLTVVLGHNAEAVGEAVAVRASAFSVPVHCTRNHTWWEGLGASLRLGLEHALATPGGGDIQAVIVLLGDQPLVTAHTLCALVRAHTETLAANPALAATVPVHQGQRGNPVIISRRLFPALLSLRGDVGARHILREFDAEILRVPVDDVGVLHDVDTPEAYAALSALEGGSP